eukprot:TRINITY_DN712_c0_g1_i1.p2 TRINITY_DN712_c0_g1~~TRINITY_DN712_c0_g1_i1.p2  ORF type:complete len:415 (+),score=113.35 TRINITY_DN712_c0_g1_i1:125-1369(+)
MSSAASFLLARSVTALAHRSLAQKTLQRKLDHSIACPFVSPGGGLVFHSAALPCTFAPGLSTERRRRFCAAMAPVEGNVDKGNTKGRSALDEMDNSGAFKRTDSSFRNWITADGSSGFPAVAGRYHLYISYACPWASRCLAFLKLKGLEHAIGVTVTNPRWERTRPDNPQDSHMGWAFAKFDNEEPDATPDPLEGAKFIRDLYEIADPSTGKFTVPVLWDKEKHTIVNNESAEITRMFNKELNAIAEHPEVDLYPAELQKEIDSVNEWVYDTINNGVYKSGFATKQKPYDEAVTALFDSLDRVEEILSKQRYLAGNVLTEADVRLFMTLIRFDEVYVVHFKCNKKLIREYPNIFNYTKELFQMKPIGDTVNMHHIKEHYYGSHPSINKFGIVPIGPNTDFSTPHDREKKFPSKK